MFSKAGAALLLLLALAAHAQELRYEPPPNFSHSAITPPEDYSSNEFNAGFQVYPFRRFDGDAEQAFRRTLLRDWIDPRYREENVAAAPEFRMGTVRGADKVLTARFAESIAGISRQRMRMLIVSGGSAAIVDASANSLATWQRAVPALNVMAATLRVEAAGQPPMVAQGGGISGLYMGSKPKYVVDLNRPVGYGSHVMALHYYLFSADGRVYRAYDDLKVPAGDPARFDFEAARRVDPVNSGRYSLANGKLRLQMGEGRPPEVIDADAPQGGRVKIQTVVYVLQR
jgi:hypothetical protein